MRRRALAFVAIAAIALLTVAAPAGAVRARQTVDTDTGVERVVRFDAVYDVGRDSSVTVTETIDYDFASTRHHGIQRDLIVKQRKDDRYDRVYPLDVLSVSASPGTPAGYKVLNEPRGIQRIRIGDPDREITGRHRYVIRYRLRGVLNGFSDHDELYWNVTGDEWLVPIETTSVRVSTPTGVTRVACFVGPRGSTLACDGAAGRAGKSSATFTNTRLAPGSGLTVVTGMQPLTSVGAAAPKPILHERWSFSRAFAATFVTVSVAVLLFLAAVAGVVALLWRRGRDRRAVGSAIDMAFPDAGGAVAARPLFEHTETPVQFEPPDRLRPAQLGTLVDEEAGARDVAATIVDLAARGYLTITEIPKHGVFGKQDWTLSRTGKDADGLLGYEMKLLGGLFGGKTSVQLSELRNKFAPKMQTVQHALYDDVVEEGWFVRRPDRVRAFWRGVGFGSLVAAGLATFLLAKFTHFGLLGVPLVLGALVLLVGARWMPSRTAKGTGVLVRAMGFRRFMAESEKERARFAERANLFSEYLPYAVMFGVTDKWARAFAGLDGQVPTPSWYVSDHAFEVTGFAHAVDGFSVASSGTLTSTPGGSGGSGFSGGSSGGGGGGGGGGSW
jgi:hypothetical protein